ncbi:MAG: Sec-independent protein translocase protein TatCy [Planctomycetes bacterium]|nr:Sec-independent protein translocase protein TatCy [Planctomycetota bacterium]
MTTAPTRDSDAPAHDRPMTLREHLEELRARVFRSVLYLIVAFVVAYVFHREIWAVVAAPIQEVLSKVDGSLLQTGLSEGFMSTFKLCGVVAVLLASPLLFAEIWGFVAKGLYETERRPARIYVPIAAFLFIEGVVFYYFLIQPATLDWLIRFMPEIPGILEVKRMIRLEDAVSFFLGMSLVVGLVFELPLVMIFAQKLDLCTWRTYTKHRKHFLMASLVLVAVLTPSGDAVSLLLCMVPVVGLYEAGILVCRIMRPDAPADDEADDAGGDGD